ncbi:MAG: DUF374 domain-containing protein [Candidatus Kapabacteria bacterium]|nr:DUF374 domain-containing protein [Candidatus Kapabacteria bacterium]
MKTKIAVLLLRMLAATWRIRVVGAPPATASVVAFWHGGMLPVWKMFATGNATGVTSLSKDGDMLAALLRSWGYDVVRGSSSRGGGEVLDAMIAAARSGRTVLVTPDGPRGPAGVFKAGAAVAAMRAGVPLVQCRVTCGFAIRLNSWDSFMIPLPFARVCVHIAEPMMIAPDASRDEVSAVLERLSNAEPKAV